MTRPNQRLASVGEQADWRICTVAGCHAQAYYPAKNPPPGQPVTAPAERCYRHRPQHPHRHHHPLVAGADMARIVPVRELLAESDRLIRVAKDAAAALDHIARELAIADSLPDHTPGAAPNIPKFFADCTGKGGDIVEQGVARRIPPCPGCDICQPQQYTATERAALNRLRLSHNLEQIRDDISMVTQLVTSISTISTKTLGIRIALDVQRCDGRPFEGSDILWVQHSRNPDNGWYRPECADAADASGLCPACRVRERRWRAEHNLTPRRHNAETEAA